MRLRRNRQNSWIREIVAETSISASDLILPIFVVEGKNRVQEIESMPGVFRVSIDNAIVMIKEAESVGIKAVMLFPVVSDESKSDDAKEAYKRDNLVCRAIQSIKSTGIKIGIIADVALDPYTTHGHDGVLNDKNEVDNDQTIEILCKQSQILAKAGADIVSPSDMMDGRVGMIRRYLDCEEFKNVCIASYSVKYNSSFYGPFRDAIQSNRKAYLDKSTYQMDIRNSKEAIREIELDVKEGADIVIIKPGLPYLDIINSASKQIQLPIWAYQVSGEYSMLKFASLSNAINWEAALFESIISFKRAGASSVISYASLEIAKKLMDL